MVHVLRVYYTLFDNKKHEEIVKKIEKLADIKIAEKKSWIQEFRHIEIKVPDEETCSKIKEDIENLLEKELGEEYYKIEHILV